MIFSESQNILLPSLVWWCSIISKSVIWKKIVCNQTWFDRTASYARMSCGKMGLLHSRSKSQQRFKMSVNICPDDTFSVCLIRSTQYLLNRSTIFFFYQTWYCCVLWCVMQKNWFTIFNVKVTARAYKVIHIIKLQLFLLCLLNCRPICI